VQLGCKDSPYLCLLYERDGKVVGVSGRLGMKPQRRTQEG